MHLPLAPLQKRGKLNEDGSAIEVPHKYLKQARQYREEYESMTGRRCIVSIENAKVLERNSNVSLA
jgi:hypothetical protein